MTKRSGSSETKATAKPKAAAKVKPRPSNTPQNEPPAGQPKRAAASASSLIHGDGEDGIIIFDRITRTKPEQIQVSVQDEKDKAVVHFTISEFRSWLRDVARLVG